MAKRKAKAPKPQGSDEKGKSGTILHGLLTVLLSILVVALVFGGAFYYVLKNNIYGLGEQFRPGLQKVPVLRLALPPLPETADPEDPKYLTQKELIDNYNAYRVKITELNGLLEEAERRIQEYESKAEAMDLRQAELEHEKARNEETLKKIEAEREQLARDIKTLSQQVHQGDPDGFKEYFEKIDPQTAKALYEQILVEDNVNQEIKNLAKTYESMDEKNAADILTEIGRDEMPLLIDLIDAMKPATAAAILENMEYDFAADLYRRLAEKKLGAVKSE